MNKPAVFFETQEEFRTWLEQNHAIATEVFVVFFKVKSGKSGMKWTNAVDQALCYGWIDSVLRPIDEESYALRFSPRRKGSIWSNINIKKVAELTKNGLMRPPGISAFEKRTPEKLGIYAFENEVKSLGENFENRFQESPTAWDFFKAQAPSYQKTLINWVVTAKQEKTRVSRLEKLISESAAGRRL